MYIMRSRVLGREFGCFDGFGF